MQVIIYMTMQYAVTGFQLLFGYPGYQFGYPGYQFGYPGYQFG